MSEKSSQESEFQEPVKLEQLRTRYLELQQELDILKQKFDDGFSEGIFGYISEDLAGEFTNKWLERIKKNTELLKNADELGIKIFGDNLEKQDKLSFQKYSKEYTISFNSKSTHVESSSVMGFCEPGGKIELKESHPSQREQLFYFVKNAKLHPTVAALVHELIHAYHQDINLDMDKELGELQAYVNGIVEVLPFNSIEDTTERISKYYGFSKDRVTSIISNILFLYSRGKGTKEVADILRNTNPTLQGDWLLEEFHIKLIMESEGISQEEKGEMIKLYLLGNQIERAKAQNIFLEVFYDWMKE